MSNRRVEHPVILDTLGFGTFLTVIAGIGSHLLSESFSPALLGIFVVFSLAGLSLIASFHWLNGQEAGTKRARSLWRAFVASSLLLLITIFVGVYQWRKEAEGGTLVIYVDEETTSPPREIKVHRGFPRFLAFLDHPKMVELNASQNKFSVSNLRCGRWYVSPQLESVYEEIGPITIPVSEPRKAQVRDSFKKRRCSFRLKAFNEAGTELEGVTIQLRPASRGLNRALKTPELLSLEVGTYEATFSMQGYLDSSRSSLSCFPEMEEEISVKLVKKADDRLVSVGPESVGPEEGEASGSVPRSREETIPLEDAENPEEGREAVPVRGATELPEKMQDPKFSAERRETLVDRVGEPGIGEPGADVLEVVRKKELNKISLEVESLLKKGDARGAIERLQGFARKYPGTEEGREVEQLIEQIEIGDGR